MNYPQITIVTRGKKRCAGPCMLFQGQRCRAGLDANPGMCGAGCPKDGTYALKRLDKVERDEKGGVRSNIDAEGE